MKPCPHCATPIDEGAIACAFCAPRAPARRVGRGFLVAFLGLLLGVAAAIAIPAARSEAEPSGSCQPRSWVDWHVAMKRECLTPAYVCHNMTPGKLLEDPELAAAFRDALVAGDPGPLASLDRLVSRMRSAYGCSDDPPARPFHGTDPRLPPGHPPVPAEPELPDFGRKGALTI